MTFFAQTPDWQDFGGHILAALNEAGIAADRFGLVMVMPGEGGPIGYSHNGDWRCYPCSLVKTFHLVNALAAIDAGRIEEEPELTRAIGDMITWSSNTATNYVIDTVTGTTGDTLLHGAEWMDFTAKRGRLNDWVTAKGWAEFEGCNITQKLMDDRRYGREAIFAGEAGENLNALTPLAAARMMWALFHEDLGLSAEMLARAQGALIRSASHPKATAPEYQLSEYLGGEMPEGVQIWSKAGHNLWTGDPKASWYKHDMIRLARDGVPPLTMVVMTQGRDLAQNYPTAFPAMGRLIWDLYEDFAGGQSLG